MVEMLGVLAVIGVLSIAGIQGYKKAVNKMHANEIMNLVMMVYNEHFARTVFGNSPLYLCSNALPSNVTSTYKTACDNSNLEMNRPGWTLNSFTIVSYRITTTRHSIYIGGVGSCMFVRS